MARRIDQHLQRMAWLMLLRYLALAALLILVFCVIRSFERQETLSLRMLFLPVLHGVSECFAHLCALAFFSALLAMRNNRELDLLACHYRPTAGLLRSYLPLLLVIAAYQALYFGFIKPDFKAMSRHAESRAALIKAQMDRRQPLDIKGNWFWCSTVEGTQLENPGYLLTGPEGDLALQAQSASVDDKYIHFSAGRISGTARDWPLFLDFNSARLPVFSGETWLDYTKPATVLLSMDHAFLRIQQRLVQFATPWLLILLAFMVMSLPHVGTWALRALFLGGLFAVHLPLQISTRKFAFDTHGTLVLLHWLPGLALLACFVLAFMIFRQRA